jgi:hypothetical protein
MKIAARYKNQVCAATRGLFVVLSARGVSMVHCWPARSFFMLGDTVFRFLILQYINLNQINSAAIFSFISRVLTLAQPSEKEDLVAR